MHYFESYIYIYIYAVPMLVMRKHSGEFKPQARTVLLKSGSSLKLWHCNADT